MTVTGGESEDEKTHVDREPPIFPRVGDSQSVNSQLTSASAGAGASLFTSPDQRDLPSAPAPVVTTAASASGAASGSKGSRLRWLVAGVATLVVLLVVGGIIVLAAPRAGSASATAHYAPADTAVYIELRLDLPGDQHDSLAAFMGHFPGFADPSTFQQKLDESLNTLVSSKSSGLDWSNDVKPWFAGQVGVFGTPTMTSMLTSGTTPGTTMPTSAGLGSQMTFVLTVNDRAKLESIIDQHLGTATVQSVDYLGVQIRTFNAPANGGDPVSFAVTDDTLLISPSIDQIKTALDVHAGGKPALADNQFYVQQLGSLHSDRLATVYYDAGQLLSAMPQPTESLLPASCTQIFAAAGQVKYVGEVRAESDHLAATMRAQIPTGGNLPAPSANKQTTLAQSMPADTVAYVEARNIGANASWLIKQGMSCMAASPGVGPLPSAFNGLGDPSALIEQFLGAKPEDYLDFVDDAALGMTYGDGHWSGGIVATVDDAAVATQRVNKLTSLIQMLGRFGSSSSGITSEEIDHNGTKITVIHVTPTDGTGSPMSLQIAVNGGKLYLGLDDFVTAALDQNAADSLSASPKYQKALAGSGDNSGIVYVDIQAALAARDANMTEDVRRQYETNVKPFLTPLSTLSAISHIDGGMVVTNAFLFVE
jgi:Protein of unknown function (DUF3352)